MEPLSKVRKWHPTGYIHYQKTLADIAVAEEEYEAARNHIQVAQQLSEDGPELNELQNRLTILESFSGWDTRWRKDAERYHQRRLGAKLPADPTLDDCFSLLTKGDMTGIRLVLGISGVSALKKAELKQYLMEHLSQPSNLRRIVQYVLDNPERTALRDLLDRDGVMVRQAFTELHGDDSEESPYLEYHATKMESVMGRLRAHGLLFSGTAGDEVIVTIPREIRPLLRETLAEM